jgi:hypothetical protein
MAGGLKQRVPILVMESRQRAATEPIIPRIASNLRPLLFEVPSLTRLPEVPSLTDLTIRTPPTPPVRTPLHIELPSPPTSQSPTRSTCRNPCGFTALTWSLRFAVHLVLISMFETVFFWLYVSKSEDTALIGLVNTYVVAVTDGCRLMNPTDRQIMSDILSALINTTTVDAAGQVAVTERTAFNDTLFRNSWLYVAGLLSLVATLTAAASRLNRPIPWRLVIGENVALVSCLGLYEWMFFHTIAFRYRAISTAELDRMVVDEFNDAC